MNPSLPQGLNDLHQAEEAPVVDTVHKPAPGTYHLPMPVPGDEVHFLLDNTDVLRNSPSVWVEEGTRVLTKVRSIIAADYHNQLGNWVFCVYTEGDRKIWIIKHSDGGWEEASAT